MIFWKPVDHLKCNIEMLLKPTCKKPSSKNPTPCASFPASPEKVMEKSSLTEVVSHHHPHIWETQGLGWWRPGGGSGKASRTFFFVLLLRFLAKYANRSKQSNQIMAIVSKRVKLKGWWYLYHRASFALNLL